MMTMVMMMMMMMMMMRAVFIRMTMSCHDKNAG